MKNRSSPMRWTTHVVCLLAVGWACSESGRHTARGPSEEISGQSDGLAVPDADLDVEAPDVARPDSSPDLSGADTASSTDAHDGDVDPRVAEPECTGFFDLTFEADLEEFGRLGCTVVDGSIALTDRYSTDYPLDTLRSLEVVTGRLDLALQKESLSGLENLRAVGSLFVWGGAIGRFDLPLVEIGGEVYMEAPNIGTLEPLIRSVRHLEGPVNILWADIPQCELDAWEERLRELGYRELFAAEGCTDDCSFKCWPTDTACDGAGPPPAGPCPSGQECRWSPTWVMSCQ